MRTMMSDEILNSLKDDIKAKLANRVLTVEEGTELGIWVTGQAIKEAWHQAIAEGPAD